MISGIWMQNDAKLNVSNHKQPEILLKVQMNRTYWCCHVLPCAAQAALEPFRAPKAGAQWPTDWGDHGVFLQSFAAPNAGTRWNPYEVHEDTRSTYYISTLSTPVLSLSLIYLYLIIFISFIFWNFQYFSTLIFAEHLWAHSEPIKNGIPLDSEDSPGSELESPCSTISTGTSRIALSHLVHLCQQKRAKKRANVNPMCPSMSKLDVSGIVSGMVLRVFWLHLMRKSCSTIAGTMGVKWMPMAVLCCSLPVQVSESL